MNLDGRERQTGSAGILAVIILAILSVVGAGMVGRTSTEVTMSANYRNGVAAQYLAESGVRWGYLYLETQLADSTTRPTILAATNSLTGKTYVNMGQDVTVYFGSGATAGKVDVTIKLDSKDSTNTAKRVIAALATVGSAKRQVILPVSLITSGGTSTSVSLTPGTWTNY